MAIGDKIYIADKQTLDDIKGKIGATTDTGGTTTAGGIFAKLNAILQQFSSNWTAVRAGKLDKLDTMESNISALSSRGGIKSVQRGVVMFPTKDNISVSISTINPQKAFVLLNNSYNCASFSSTHTYGSSLVELTSNTLTLTPSWAEYEGAMNNPVSYQIIEYY